MEWDRGLRHLHGRSRKLFGEVCGKGQFVELCLPYGKRIQNREPRNAETVVK